VSELTADQYESIGLQKDHAYSVLDAIEIHAKDGNKANLLMMRNPWGKVEWKGDWSDASDLWTPELKK